MRKENTIRDSLGDRIVITIFHIILAIILVIIMYPLLHILASSISSTESVIAGKVTIFPVEPTLLAYQAVIKNHQVLIGFANTVFYTVVGTTFQVILTILIAFPLSRREFVGRKVLMIFLVFTMFFEGGLIPTYMIVKNLGLIDTRWALIFPKAIGVFQVIIAVTFYRSTIPTYLY